MMADVDPEIRKQVLNEVIAEIRTIPCWIAGPGNSEFDLDGLSHREFVLDRIKWMRDGDDETVDKYKRIRKVNNASDQ